MNPRHRCLAAFGLVAALVLLPVPASAAEPVSAPEDVPPTAGAADDANERLNGQRTDLERVRTAYVHGSRAFGPEGRAAALKRVARALERTQPLSPPAFFAELMAIAALAGNGHDFVDTGQGWYPRRRLPARLLWFSDGLVLARTSPAFADHAGARVVALNGRSLAEVESVLMRHSGAPPGFARHNLLWLLESPEMLVALGLGDDPGKTMLRVCTEAGRTTDLVLPSTDLEHTALDQGRVGVWAAGLSAGEAAAGWRTGRVNGDDPLHLQAPSEPFRQVDLRDMEALYLQFRQNHDAAGTTVQAFVDEVQRTLDARPPRHIVVDQRFNHGGNSDLTVDLMRRIGRWDRGRVYVLVGPQTFSAGIVSTAALLQASGGRAVLVGEPVGDRLAWWSEGEPVCLAHSGHCLHRTTGLWDLRHGCASRPGCYGDRFGITVPRLEPDLPAPFTVESWRAGRDPGMEAVRSHLEATVPR